MQDKDSCRDQIPCSPIIVVTIWGGRESDQQRQRASSSDHLVQSQREKNPSQGGKRGKQRGRKGSSFKKESNSGSPTFSLYIAQSPRTNRRRVTAPSPSALAPLAPAPLRAASLGFRPPDWETLAPPPAPAGGAFLPFSGKILRGFPTSGRQNPSFGVGIGESGRPASGSRPNRRGGALIRSQGFAGSPAHVRGGGSGMLLLTRWARCRGTRALATATALGLAAARRRPAAGRAPGSMCRPTLRPITP